MEEQRNESTHPVNPRRRKRSKAQIFKEVYFPVLIAGVAVLLILIFVIGSITRAVQKGQAEKQASIEASIAEQEEQARLALESQELIAAADQLAAEYDYESAISMIDAFSGDITEFPDLAAKRNELEQAMSQLIEWNDPSQVVNLSFQLLIADPERAFAHSTYGSSFNRNFITTTEFSNILQQLYNNGYILVSMNDFITTQVNEEGNTVYTSKPMYLPSGKKPLMLTQTNVNYNIYLVDSDGDKLPDKDGGGFAYNMIANGSFTNEMIDNSGQVVSGAYDLVPILESFIAQNPSFSYKGARATLALTGYNGLFGHRTYAQAKEDFGEDQYQSAIVEAQTVASALQQSGYELAFYTYENISYGESSATEIQADLSSWNEEVVPLIGSTETIVYAQMTDISTEQEYAGDKYTTLQDAGFRYYLGFCNDGKPWTYISDNYVRQGRIMVTGSNLAYHSDWFTGMFDAAAVLDSSRGDIPQ